MTPSPAEPALTEVEVLFRESAQRTQFHSPARECRDRIAKRSSKAAQQRRCGSPEYLHCVRALADYPDGFNVWWTLTLVGNSPAAQKG
jgi:hypothetical protein